MALSVLLSALLWRLTALAAAAQAPAPVAKATSSQAAASPAHSPTAAPSGNAWQRVQPGEDVAEPFVPLRPRSEEEQDTLRSLVLFSAARNAEYQNDFPAALAHYERAFRYDPKNVEALRRVSELSEALGQSSVTACYDSLLVQLAPTEPIDLLRAVIYLREAGHPDRALAAYERGIRQRHGATVTPAWVELHKLAGEMYLQAENYHKAADALAQVHDALERPRKYGLSADSLKLIQEDADSLLLTIADALLRAGRGDEAASVFQQAERVSGDRGVLLFGLARIAAAAHRDDEALENLELYLDQHLKSQDEGPYRLLADILSKQKRPDALLKILQRSEASDEGNEPLGRFLAEQYLLSGRPQQARQLYEKLLTRKPSSLLYQGLIRVLREQGSPGALLTALGDAVGRSGVLSVLGHESEAIRGNAALLKALIAEADARLKKDPAELKFGPRLAVALLAADARQFDVAGRYFELAIEADPDQKGTLLSAWGFALLTGDQFAEAARVFRRALDEHAISDDNAELHFYLAGALAMAGQYDDALKAARQAASGPNPTPDYLNRVAWVLYRAGRYDEAKRAYADLIKRFDGDFNVPGGREVMRQARLTLSNLNVLTNNLPEAEELLEQVLDESPDNVAAENDLGYLWADQGKHLRRALMMLREAVAAEPDNDAYRDSLGWALFRSGRDAEALTELRQAAAAKQPDGVVLDHLGDLLEKTGRPDEAIDAWRRAITLMKDQQDSTKRKATIDKLRRAEASLHAAGGPK